jgi:hypothetical protein
MERSLAGSAEDLKRFHVLLSEQGMGGRVDAAQALEAKRRADLGITSLEIIMLVASYMSMRGADTSGFRPEWVPLLDDIAGILSVMREIDRQAIPA